MRVLDAGPILHAHIERFDDPDIETGLEQSGLDIEGAAYRLIELDVSEIDVTAWFPMKWTPTRAMQAIQRGEQVPPIVVVRAEQGSGYALIDGVNRTYAHWFLRRPKVRAYELLVGGHS